MTDPTAREWHADARALADAIPDGLVVADGQGRVTLVSAAAARMFGIDADLARGRALGDVVGLRDQGDNDWVTFNRPYAGISTRTGVPEQAWFLPDGTEVLVTARIHRPSLAGPIDWVSLSMRSGRGRARLDRERSDLVATVAHELRSPLTGVKGFVRVLLSRWDKLTDEQKKLMLTTVNADADRLSRLIGELLDVARIDTGRLSLASRPSDCSALICRVVDSFAAGTARPIVADLPDDLPQIWVDPDKFTQVLTNLIENAVRHGAGTVTVAAARLPSGGDFDGVQMSVCDEGAGIAPEIRRRVFTKFWTDGLGGGSGLGLYIVNGLVRAHGGTVGVEDAPGGGARIEVTWPSQERHLD